MPAQRPWRIRDRGEDRHLVNSAMDDDYCAARARLFPAAMGREITDNDVNDLITRFRSRTEHLRADRNKHRAHAFENKGHNFTGPAKLLSIEDVREFYREARVSEPAA